MKVVIQCAARKQPDAKTFVAVGGSRVVFVARPEIAPRQAGVVHARPDDDCGDGETWRKRLIAYNEEAATNPLGLLPAYRLYSHDSYSALVDRFGMKHVFILSGRLGPDPGAVLDPELRHHVQCVGPQETHRDCQPERFGGMGGY